MCWETSRLCVVFLPKSKAQVKHFKAVSLESFYFKFFALRKKSLCAWYIWLKGFVIVQCYAAMEITDIERKEIFRKQLHAVEERFPKGNIMIVLGDLRAGGF